MSRLSTKQRHARRRRRFNQACIRDPKRALMFDRSCIRAWRSEWQNAAAADIVGAMEGAIEHMRRWQPSPPEPRWGW